MSAIFSVDSWSRWASAFFLMITTASVDRIANADFVGVSTAIGYAWDRPLSLGGPATFQAWESFTSVGGPNHPETVFGAGTGDASAVTTGPGNALFGFGGAAGTNWNTINAAGTPNVIDTAAAGSSFLTSGGNIYSPTGIVAPRIFIPNNIDGIAGNQTTGTTSIALQVRTQGSLPDLNSFRLTDPTSGSLVSPTNVEVLASLVLGGFGGTLQDVLIDFAVPGNADLYEIQFAAGSSSMSLDRIAVDTFYSATAVPEPTSLGLVSLFALWGAAIRGRRPKARPSVSIIG